MYICPVMPASYNRFSAILAASLIYFLFPVSEPISSFAITDGVK